MKNGQLKGGGSCKYMLVIMQRFTHRRKGSSLFGKKKENNQEQLNNMNINCEVLLQEFNKHLLFIYNNA